MLSYLSNNGANRVQAEPRCWPARTDLTWAWQLPEPRSAVLAGLGSTAGANDVMAAAWL